MTAYRCDITYVQPAQGACHRQSLFTFTSVPYLTLSTLGTTYATFK